MGEQKNLSSQEGVEKLKKLAKAADICMFATNLTGNPISARPMSTRDVDDDGTIYFYSRDSSDKNAEISKDDRVQLFYSNNSDYEYMSVFGRASIVEDEALAKELWTNFAKAWFSGGVDDPELTVIKVVPENVYYWDTKHNKMVNLVKMALSALTGTETDDGVYGHINV
ncbi:MAG: pyridoxamine 5'-phosphate oxidase family protein [Chitinophagaceae bacterium]